MCFFDILLLSTNIYKLNKIYWLKCLKKHLEKGFCFSSIDEAKNGFVHVYNFSKYSIRAFMLQQQSPFPNRISTILFQTYVSAKLIQLYEITVEPILLSEFESGNVLPPIARRLPGRPKKIRI